MFTRFIWLKTAHQFLGRGARLVYGTPHWLWFVHEWVSLADLHAVHDLPLVQDLLVLVCELEDLVRLPLLWGLVVLQVLHHACIAEEL